MLAEPTLPWEHQDSPVLEGPYGIISPGGRVFVVYSADSCNTPAYKLGALELNLNPDDNATDRDPMLPASWTKLPEPLFQTTNGLYGPAHNAFFKSPDGTEDWIVFHANLKETDRCGTTRQTFIQKIGWKEDDTPDLGVPLPVGTEITPPSGE
jgi:GH43 family beta-xylosidase